MSMLITHCSLLKEVSMVAGQNSASVRKDFLSTFWTPLPGYPISCQIDNVIMHCELLFEKNILVFGKYDLVFCCPNMVYEFGPGYSTTVLARTFCELIPLTGSDILEMLPSGTTDIQAVFAQPLHVRIKLGKPLKLWELLKSLLIRKTWVEVAVESQITAEITQSHCEAECESPESLRPTRSNMTAEQENMSSQPQEATVDLETLAEQVQKIIVQRQEEKAAKDEAARREPDRPGQSTIPEPEAKPPDQGEPEVLNTAKVSELVLDILHQREAARARQAQHGLQNPPATGRPAQFTAPRPAGAVGRPAAPVPMSLDQIPSRPGLEVTIHNPPPKPPGMGG